MSRMLELVRTSQLSSHQMMTASKGALRVSAVEMLEILVYIAEHNKVFRETARMTLAGWDESSAKQIAADPNTPREILDYWLSSQNIRPVLLPGLVENPSASAAKLADLATTAKSELADVLIASQRVRNSLQILRELSGNHALSGAQAARVQALMEGTRASVPAQSEAAASSLEQTATNLAIESLHQAKAASEAEQMVSTDSSQLPEANPAKATSGESVMASSDAEADTALATYLSEHANEIVAEGDKPFKAIGGVFDEVMVVEQPAPARAFAAAAASGAATDGALVATQGAAIAGAADAATITSKPHKSLVNPEDEKRGSTLQKIAKLDITGRIQLAMKGTKEERSILIRDGTKIIALAVLESPKISDGEVEKFASQKNVLEAVLRAIPMKRRFAKNYVVIRNLVANPRTPLDVALGLMKNLLIGDLKNLSGNKEVSETVRKMALRMFRQKNEAVNKT